jgi:hypothetical protein
MGDESRLIREGLIRRQDLAWVQLLMTPIIHTDSSASEPGVVSKGSHTTTLSIVQELEIQDRALALIKSGKDFGPATLVLEAVSKKDVGVVEGVGFALGKFLQSNNVCLLGGLAPLANRDHVASDSIY